MFEDIFKRKKPNAIKLCGYGFTDHGDKRLYETEIMDGDFRLFVSVDGFSDVYTDLIDTYTGEPYVLYKTDASGTFVGEIRTAVKKILEEIADACFEQSVFKSDQADMIIKYIGDTYGDEIEFLWPKFPDNAIWRRKDNKKSTEKE